MVQECSEIKIGLGARERGAVWTSANRSPPNQTEDQIDQFKMEFGNLFFHKEA